jgi:hypothetical protein
MPSVRTILGSTLRLPRVCYLMFFPLMTLALGAAPLFAGQGAVAGQSPTATSLAQGTNAAPIAPSLTPGEPASPPSTTETIALSDIHPGMQGVAYTIFVGDQLEKFDLVVIGVLENFLGPRQSIILVELRGAKVEYTGVVAGMSGSPVYLDGKLAGALSLKLGVFDKEALAGVTPIHDILDPPSATPGKSTTAGNAGGASDTATYSNVVAAAGAKNSGAITTGATSSGATSSAPGIPGTLSASDASQNFPLPTQFASNGLPSAASLTPIETPLVFSGIAPAAVQPFASQIQSFGFVAAQGGTAPARTDDAKLVPGDMAGMVLVQGDVSISSACTVTAVRGDNIFLCGHPFLNLGNVAIPMARSRVVTTLSSTLASTKIVNIGGDIGTITGDHTTAVTGKLGASPAMVPLDLTIASPLGEKKFHVEMVNHPKLTPLLAGLSMFSALSQNRVYGEGTTLHLSGEVRLQGHAPVIIEDTFAPGDTLTPDGLQPAVAMQTIFARLYSNTFEPAVVEHIALKVEAVPGRQSYTIDSAWLEKGEAAPGETLRVRVLVHPYRGAAHVEETTVHVPDQIARGTTLRVLVTDGETLNRASRGFSVSSGGGANGLDQLIALLNRERRNDRVYVGLFSPTPTMLWDDKELPNVPLSEINLVDGRPTPGTVQVLRESLAGEASFPLDGPVSGVISLNLQIR